MNTTPANASAHVDASGFKRDYVKAFKYITIFYIICSAGSALATPGGQDAGPVKNATFNGVYSDSGPDMNMNDLHDFIVVSVGIVVPSPGEYTLSGSLHDASGDEIVNASNRTHLGIGIKSIHLKFSGLKSGGIYHLKNLTLYDEDGVSVDHIDDAYATLSEYHGFDRDSKAIAWLTGNYTERGIDVNGDGLHDYLAIEVGVHVQSPGDYSLMGYLRDLDDEELGWTMDYRNIPSGNHTMNLVFDGRGISNQKANGPYSLGNVTLFYGSSFTGMKICDHIRRAYATSAYSYSDFGA